MKKIILSIVTAAFISAPAMAFEDRLSVGLSYNHGVYAADGKEVNQNRTGGTDRTTNVTGKAFVDTYASVLVELSLNDTVSIGVDYAFDAPQTPKNINSGEGGDGTTDIEVEASFEDLTTVYLLAKSDLGVYAKVGISQMDIDVTSKNAGTYPDQSTDGTTAAIGYEAEMADGLAIRAEVAYHSFDDVEANNGITSSNSSQRNEITVSNMEGATARVSLVKSF
jgi:hypothetical protein|tara:strand:- start:146 stop:814 length:669 start_codon:yes stop_codon:yes gene_type:complete